MKKIIAGILLLIISFTANAQEGPRTYWALGGSLLTFDAGGTTVDPINVFGRLGYDFNENIGVGVEGSFSLIEDEIGGADISVSTTFFYLKGSIPVGDDAKVYAMIGPANHEITFSAGGISLSFDDDDTGIGFGFEKTLDTFSISVDYITYYDKLGIDVNAFNLGLVTYF